MGYGMTTYVELCPCGSWLRSSTVSPGDGWIGRPLGLRRKGGCGHAWISTVGLTLGPGAVLLAAFALDDHTGRGSSSLSVRGNLDVQSGASLLLGCEPGHFTCLDDPAPEDPTLSSQGQVSGNLIEQEPLGVVVHNSIIDGTSRRRVVVAARAANRRGSSRPSEVPCTAITRTPRSTATSA